MAFYFNKLKLLNSSHHPHHKQIIDYSQRTGFTSVNSAFARKYQLVLKTIVNPTLKWIYTNIKPNFY